MNCQFRVDNGDSNFGHSYDISIFWIKNRPRTNQFGDFSGNPLIRYYSGPGLRIHLKSLSIQNNDVFYHAKIPSDIIFRNDPILKATLDI